MEHGRDVRRPPRGRLSPRGGGPLSQDADVLVVGSGFGGAVSALRLAEKGYSVVVLEQGRRFADSDFARTNWSLRDYIWAPRLGLRGIQVLTFLKHALVLHGRGVGGGSLVYANVLAQPPEDVLRRPEWGEEDWPSRLEPHFVEARRMLGATPCPGLGRADEALRDVVEQIGVAGRLEPHEVGVYFGSPGETVPDPYFDGDGPARTGCTRCAACMVGCRIGAKNTLEKNYLWLAERRGVRIIPETEALGIRPTDGGYEVVTRRSLGLRRPRRVWKATRVVVSGGVIGSVKLLQRSKSLGWLTALSDTLGTGVRTNSEALLAADAPMGSPSVSDHVAITSGVQIDPDTHVEVVRFNRGSDALFWLTWPLAGFRHAHSRLARLAGGLGRSWKAVTGLWPLGRAGRTAIVLAMQSTEGSMTLRYRPARRGTGSLHSDLNAGEAAPVSEIPSASLVTHRLAERLGGKAWRTWPPALYGAPVTAHILGGCRIGATPAEGVVDEAGRVHGHPGLYVVDGSVLPVNLGVNPSLTITAVAEWMMGQLPPKDGREAPCASP